MTNESAAADSGDTVDREQECADSTEEGNACAHIDCDSCGYKDSGQYDDNSRDDDLSDSPDIEGDDTETGQLALIGNLNATTDAADESNDPVIFADQKFETCEISRYLSKNPERAAQIKTVMASDEGVRYPIDVTVIDMSNHESIDQHSKGSKRRMRVRKGCLYQWENERVAKLECRKSRRTDVLEAEAALGATGTKRSYGWKLFREGYYAAWIRHNKLLFGFYRHPAIRSDRFRCNIRRQQIYDRLVDQLFKLMSVQQHNGPGADNRSKLVVMGQQQVSTWHKGHRPSKHAVFWRYFALKGHGDRH